MTTEGKYNGSELKDYTNIKLIGKGAYAEVKEGIHKLTKDKVALKIYEKSRLYDPMKKDNVIREIRILEQLDHPNIMKIFDSIETSHQVIIVLEHITGISLNNYLAKLPEHKLDDEKAQTILSKILSAVAYCHSKGVIHRDLKLENILITPTEDVKLIDFGFSVSKETKLSTFCGTPTYMAPEIITMKQYEGPPTDAWALGIIAFVLLNGYFPFQAVRSQELYKRISKGLFSMPKDINIKFQKLIDGLLCIDPKKRKTVVDVLQELL